VAKERPGRFDLSKLEPMLGDLHDRLAGVVIERLDYADFIARYDSPQTLFYLDPPYWGCEDDYGKELFSRDQFEAMADQIKSMRGRCLMSINDVTPIRTAFAGLYMESVATTYTAGGKGADRSSGSAKELIVSNFDLKGGLNAV
jgi:DNA adenine methylase